jgi:hypothetical protein
MEATMSNQTPPSSTTKRVTHRPKGVDFWRKHVQQWLNSGLSQTQYCRENKLSIGSFGHWKIKLVGPDDDTPPVGKKPLLLPVRIERKTPPFTIEILINDRVALRVPSDQDPKVVKRWIEALS